jgi:hypothetical protein
MSAKRTLLTPIKLFIKLGGVSPTSRETSSQYSNAEGTHQGNPLLNWEVKSP